MTVPTRVLKISEVAADRQYAVVGGPFGSKLGRKDYIARGVPVLRGSNLPFDKRIDLTDLVFVSTEKAEQDLFGNLAHPGDVIVTQRGTLGQVGLIPTDCVFERFIVSQSQMKLTVDSTKADARFLYYYLKSPGTTRRLVDRASSSGVPHINLEVFRNFDVELPDLEVQRSVADVLTFFDDLIDNTRRRIEILEEMARLLYREWFVHLRFPGHEDVELVDSDLGPIPRSWKARRLGEILELSYGRALRADDRRGGPTAVYGSGGQVGWHDMALVSGPGIVVGRKGNVGSVYWSDRDFFPIDTTYYVESALPLRFLDQLLRTLRFVDSHAAVPGLSRDQAYGLVVAEPDSDLMSLYDTAVDPMYSLRQVLSDQVACLREARDLILPRLVSGELDVSELDLDLVPV